MLYNRGVSSDPVLEEKEKERAMGTISVIPIHSIIDLTTNSSSELFICNTQKTKQEIDDFFENLSELLEKRIGIREIEVHHGPDALLKILQTISICYLEEGSLATIIFRFIPFSKDFSDKIPRWCYKDLDVDYPRSFYSKETPEQERRAISQKVWDEKENKENQMWEKIENFFRENDEVLRKSIKDFVVIRSSSDNSIPYEVFEIIDSKYNSYRIHLG